MLTTKKNASGMFEVYRDNSLIGTGTEQYASNLLAQNPPEPVKPFGETSPILSSKDVAGQFASNGAKLDTKYPPPPETPKPTETKPALDSKTQVEKNSEAGKSETGDPLLDKQNAWATSQQAKFEADAADKKAQRETLYQTSLSAVDATYQNTVNNINLTYDRSIQEQKRINQLTIDRVKAYGLGSSAIFNPIEFTDAVSARESEADATIRDLDSKRNNLLAEAKAARDTGANGLLKAKLDALDGVEKDMRDEIQKAAEEATRQYNVMRQVRIDGETKHKEAVQKVLDLVKVKFAQAFADAKTPEEKDKLVKKIMAENGIMENSDLYWQIYSILGAASRELSKTADEKIKAEADLAYKKAQTKTEGAQYEKVLADTAKARAEARKIGIDAKGEDTMRKDIPAFFASKDEFAREKEGFVKKYGKKGREYWDAIFTDADGLYKYPTGTTPYKNLYEQAQSSGKKSAVLTSPDGTQQVLISDLTPAQIKEAKAAGWK